MPVGNGFAWLASEPALLMLGIAAALEVLAYYIPGLRQLCDLAYRLVAAYRYTIMGKKVARGECSNGACAVHFGPKR